MTDHGYEWGQDMPAPERPVQRNTAAFAHMAGATVSLALVAGIAVWGYGVIARDVSGVPVVQALEGPVRMAPEDPGGTLADHQGLAVNAIAGEGTAEGPADRVVLAGRPSGLAEEDVSHGMLDRIAASETKAGAPLAPVTPGSAVIPADSPLAQSDDPRIRALVAQLADGAEPFAPLAAPEQPVLAALGTDDMPDTPALRDALPVPDTEASDTESDAAADLPPGDAPARSLRPQTRPASAARPAAAPDDPVVAAIRDSFGARAATPPAPEVTDVDPDTLPAGTRLVQIGAFDSPETARTEWSRLMSRMGAYLESKDRVIQRASSGGRTFYRLRAHGFADLPDAQRFCAAFVAEGVDCIPVVTR